MGALGRYRRRILKARGERVKLPRAVRGSRPVEHDPRFRSLGRQVVALFRARQSVPPKKIS